MFQLRQLKIFLAAAETLSFTQAGKRIHLSQPAVTEQIRALEDAVGQILFLRQNNVLALTEAGKRLVVRARELLAMADAALLAVQQASSGDTQAISVAAPQTLCTSLLIPLLADHVGKHPAVRIDIQERNSLATCHAVAEGVASLGLIHGWPEHGAAVEATLLAHDSPTVLLPLGHPLADAESIQPDQLHRFPLILTAQGCRYRQYVDTILQHAPERPVVRAVADSVPALAQMVEAGLGISVLPRIAVSAVATNTRVVGRDLVHGSDGLPICAITAAGAPSLRLLALIDLLRLAVGRLDQPVSAFDVQDRTGAVAIAQ